MNTMKAKGSADKVEKVEKVEGGNITAGEKSKKADKPIKVVKPVVGKPVVVKVVKVAKEAKVDKTKKTPTKTAKSTKPTKPTKPTKETKAVSPSLYKRHDKNPFRLNSSYGKVFDCFASFKNGIRRDELLKKVAEAVGKDLKHASYDLAVILSAKDSNTGMRHRSCQEGFWVKRENDHLTLMID